MSEVFLESHQFQLARQGDDFVVNGETLSPELQQLNPYLWQVLHENRSYDVFIQKIDTNARTVTLSVNGKRTTVRIQTRIEKLLKELGMEDSMQQKLDSLKAPMPGLVHSWKVAEGDTIEEGDPLLILEAMKMENVIKSPGNGTIARLHVKEKASVEKNALLITFV